MTEFTSILPEAVVSTAETERYLRNVPVFAKLCDDKLREVAKALKLKSFAAGETLIQKGQVGTHFFLLKSGTVGFIVDGGEVKHTYENTGEYFGEIALMNEHSLCTATAHTTSGCECYMIDKGTFDRLLKKSLAAAMASLNTGLEDIVASSSDGNIGSSQVTKIEAMLDEYDIDGDGEFSRDEVTAIIVNLISAKKQKRVFKYVALAAFVALLAVCASMFAMVLVGNEVSKDQAQDESGRLKVKGTDTTVQVAITNEHMTNHPLSSRVPDKYLAELKTFMYTDPTDGSSSNVQVNSFVRVPEYGAMCGSVVILQTSLGNFTLDDEALFHSELDQWVEVAGTFDLNHRRRLHATENGRRQLGAANANGVFAFLESKEETFECVREWMDDKYTVEPTSPKLPYAYVAHSIESCWEADYDDDETDDGSEKTPTGSTARCTSTYGPNAGKFKPGVSSDGKEMLYLTSALYTENKSISIHRYANHPLMMHVEVEDFVDRDGSGNITILEFQLYDRDPEHRHLCTKKFEPDPGNVTFEDSLLSLLSVKDGLRHWSISQIDTGLKVADYFDHAATGNQPHSVHHHRNLPDHAETRYKSFKDDLTEQEVQDWLDEHFEQASQYDVTNPAHCTDADRLLDVPARMNPFDEDPSDVDFYTKAMLEIDIAPEYEDAMAGTSMDEYWGAAMYLRRLLSQHLETDSVMTVSPVAPVIEERSTEKINYNDPWFWREVSTALELGNNSGVVLNLWTAMAMDNWVPNATTESFLEGVSAASGLTVDELLTPAAYVTYTQKSTIQAGTRSSTGFSISGSSAPEKDQYVVFGDTCGTAYKLTAVPGNPASSAAYSVNNVTTPDDISTNQTNEEIIGATIDMMAAGIAADGSYVFFFNDYHSAQAASCDAAEPMDAASAGRRMLQQEYEPDLEILGSLLDTYMHDPNERHRIFDTDVPMVPTDRRQLGGGFEAVVSSAVQRGALDVAGRSRTINPGLKYVVTYCTDDRGQICEARFDQDLKKPPFSLLKKNMAVALKGSVGIRRLSGTFYNSGRYNSCSGGRCHTYSIGTECNVGFEEFVHLNMIKTGSPPAFIKSLKLDKYYSQTTDGEVKLTHGHCMPGGNQASSFIRLEAGVIMSAGLRYCKAAWGGGVSFSATLTGGVLGSVQLNYKKPGTSSGSLVGYVDGNIKVGAKVGNCKCKSKWISKAKCNTCHGSCSTVGGASGNVKVTAQFVDIKVGDSTNGVDLKLSASGKVRAKVTGSKFTVASFSAGPFTVANVSSCRYFALSAVAVPVCAHVALIFAAQIVDLDDLF
eukprot:COSAG05_NODE_222_length_13641_cov_73.452001_7_plen_1293_part_00